MPEILQDEDWDTLGLALHHGHDMPSWWEAGYHDNSLVKVVDESLFMCLNLADWLLCSDKMALIYKFIIFELVLNTMIS